MIICLKKLLDNIHLTFACSIDLVTLPCWMHSVAYYGLFEMDSMLEDGILKSLLGNIYGQSIGSRCNWYVV